LLDPDILEVSFRIKILRWQIYGLTFEPRECVTFTISLRGRFKI
jgi:hypothetical protein